MPITIEVPVSLIKKISKAAQAFHELENELEDHLLLSDPEFLKKMRRSRKNHLDARTKPLEKLKDELCTK